MTFFLKLRVAAQDFPAPAYWTCISEYLGAHEATYSNFKSFVSFTPSVNSL